MKQYLNGEINDAFLIVLNIPIFILVFRNFLHSKIVIHNL
jgi:hypothetical protein